LDDVGHLGLASISSLVNVGITRHDVGHSLGTRPDQGNIAWTRHDVGHLGLASISSLVNVGTTRHDVGHSLGTRLDF
jgi:hypothetical protein